VLAALSTFLLAAPLTAAPPAADPAKPADDARALAARINQHLAAGWKAAGVEPAPLAGDAEFLRRASIDLAGRIPTVAEARAFLRDRAPDKRERLIERLLERPRYVAHFVNVWRALLLPEADTNLQTRFLTPQFEIWLRKQLQGNVPYDKMVRDLLTTPLGPEDVRNVYGRGQQDATPVAFYLAKEMKPENLAASTSRLFLGVRLECAQCHDHPFATWSRDQFWSYAAFFAGVRRQGPGGDFVSAGRERKDKREIEVPGTGRVVQANFLDGSEPQFKFKINPRQTLADWMTAADNPYFARATANRLWAYFFGIGLVDPVDEMVGSERRASHPELLHDLARTFAAHRFDLKFLIRAITQSRAYQLTSAGTSGTQPDPQLFARRAVRGMSPEQLFDSVACAIGYDEVGPTNPRVAVFGNRSARTEFLNRFARQGDRTTEHQTSILQALALMNGKLIAQATDLEQGETLAAVADAPFMDLNERLETLYLATLSRPPSERELMRLSRYVKGEKDLALALADVFWALLNSGQFLLNP
jgi:hypothetical protein